MVDTNGALSMLKGRGIDVPYSTLAQWVRDGKFPGAEREDTPRGPVWKIPAAAVERFTPPTKGRPKRTTKAKAQRASKGAS